MGNHESEQFLWQRFGFQHEIDHQFKGRNDVKELLIATLKYLPDVLFLKKKSDKKWFQFCHGAFDDYYQYYLSYEDMENISTIVTRFLSNNSNTKTFIELSIGKKKGEIRRSGFKWADINVNKINDFSGVNDRGFIYDKKEIEERLYVNKLYALISGHQDAEILNLVPKNDTFTHQHIDNKYCKYRTH